MRESYTTTSITWDDGDYTTEAASPMQAAIKHAVDGWENEEIDAAADDEDPSVGDRDATVIRVTAGDGSVTVWRVTWDFEAERGTASKDDSLS